MLTDPLLSITLPSSPARPPLPTRKLLYPSPDHPDDYILELDNSTLEKFTICQRRAENYSIFSREAARDDSATSFGKLFHSCEELRIRHGWSDTTARAQHELVAEHFLHHPVSPTDHRTSDRMIRVLKTYNERYATDAIWDKVYKTEDGEKVVERPFKVKLCTIPVNSTIPYLAEQLLTDIRNVTRVGAEENFEEGFTVRSIHVLWTGRIDLMLWDSNLLWVMDHKTSREGGKDFYEYFRLATQTRGYAWAGQKLTGKPVAGLILNAVIVRPPLKTERSSSPREEFDRKSYFYSADALVEWELSTRATVSDFVSSLVRGFFPMTGPKSFLSPCCRCDYNENCLLPREQRTADLANESLYRDVVWNPISE